MAPEPPPGYVAFVARHLDTLRDDAAQAMGDESEGDHLYPEVLSDVAMRWRRLELRRRVLKQATVADEYLHRALARRVQRIESERFWDGQGEMWFGEIEVFRPDVYRPIRSSAAARLAPHLQPANTQAHAAPLAEAAIAWWHAYETRRRQRQLAVLVLAVLVLAVLARLGTPVPK
jgi:hypothetical protein